MMQLDQTIRGDKYHDAITITKPVHRHLNTLLPQITPILDDPHFLQLVLFDLA